MDLWTAVFLLNLLQLFYFVHGRYNSYPNGQYNSYPIQQNSYNSYPTGQYNSYPSGQYNSYPNGQYNSYPTQQNSYNSYPTGQKNFYPTGKYNSYPIQQNSYTDTPPCYTPYYGQDVATGGPYQILNGIPSGSQCIRICRASFQCTSIVFDRVYWCCFLYSRQLGSSDLMQSSSRNVFVLDRQCVGSGSSLGFTTQTPSFTTTTTFSTCKLKKS